MTKAAYMLERAPYLRPQGMLWADNYGNLVAYPETVNLVTNPDFETDTSGWTALNGATIARNGTSAYSGSYSLLLTTSTTSLPGIKNSTRVAVTAGLDYTYSAYLRDVTNTNSNWRIALVYYDAATGGSQVGSQQNSTSITPNTSGWTRVSITHQVPATATHVEFYIQQTTTAVSGRQTRIDAIFVQQSSVLNAYADAPSYFYAPDGYEVHSSTAGDNFIILSDHNRKPMDFKIQRLEKRERMINGRMRSYHVADKLTISTSWENLPSRSFSTDPQFSNADGPTSGLPTITSTFTGANALGETERQYTVDGGAGGADLLKWYEDHQGPFWVYLSYDKPDNFNSDKYNHLDQYSQIVEMYISDFSYTVQKRGSRNMDFWNVSVTLEEV